MKVTRGAIDYEAMLDVVDNQEFEPRVELARHSTFAGLSRFSTWKPDESLWEGIAGLVKVEIKDLPIYQLWEFVQVQKYDVGQYILPHMDSYQVGKLHIFNLTGNGIDGLAIMEDGLCNHYVDEAGNHNDFDNHAKGSFHWVNPVRDLRYSLVIGV